MVARSAVSQLPEEIRAELERRLVRSSFSGYEQLAAWLTEQGFEISKSSLHRYGSKFEERAAQLKVATEQARAIVAETPDDEGAISEALMRLVQEKLFSVLIDFEVDPKKPLNLGSLAKAIAELGRASVTQKKWQTEVKAKVDAAAESVTKIAASGGLSKSSVDELRRQILGIAS